MLEYTLKSVACLAILFVFYKVFLEKENMHVFKRFYLLGSLALSLLIPALVFTEYVEVAPVLTNIEFVTPGETVYSNDVIQVPQALDQDITDIAPLLWIVYLIGLFFFGIKFLRNLIQIFRRIQRNPKHKLSRFTQVLLKETIPPHTFFSYIFLNKTKLESNEIPKEVLLHEETHARQKHSYDVVLVEFLQVLFWVNPMVYFIKKAIKLNHEFLADQAVLKKDIDKATYQNTLLSYLSPDSEKKYQPKLANAINYSSIKKRFKIMKTHTSKRAIFLRTLLLIPLLAVLLYGFSDTKVEVIMNDSQDNEPTITNSIHNNKEATLAEIAKYNKLAKSHNLFSDHGIRPQESEIRTVKSIYSYMSEKQKRNAEVFPVYPTKKLQDGASKKQIAEYNALANKYNTVLVKSKSIQIKKKDVERLEYIYGLMSDKQKAAAEPLPDFPEPPPPPKTPKAPKEPKQPKQPKQLKEPKEPKEPKAPKIKKGEKSDIPPPPTKNEDYIINEIKTQEIYAVEESGLQFRIDSPPSPPTPPEPIDHIIEMAKKDAKFYFEGKAISSDKAIKLIKNNDEINIDSRTKNRKQPVVKLSVEPMNH